MGKLDDLLGKVELPPAPGWQPETGDKIAGWIVDIDTADVGGFGEYPLLTVRQENGEEISLHCFHQTLRSVVERKKPQIGDVIAVKYLGTTPSNIKGHDDYHNYRMVIERNGTLADVPERIAAQQEEPF